MIPNFKDLILSILEDPNISQSKILNARSKLGISLYFYCVKSDNVISIFDELVNLFNKRNYSPEVSIVLLSSIIFTYNFLPYDSKSLHFKEKSDLILNNLNMNNEDFVSAFLQFLKSGGNLKLPCPKLFIKKLLNFKNKSGKLITEIIYQDPVKLSSKFWMYLKQKKIEIESSKDFIELISMVTMNEYLELPKIKKFKNGEDEDDDEFISEIVEICKNNLSSSFYLIECSLTTFKWLIRHKKYQPDDLKAEYSSEPLNNLVIDCWAEYASYGDLSKIPYFSQKQNLSLSLLLKLVSQASKNPHFSFNSIFIDHWLFDEILIEFNGDKRKKPFDHSIYELSKSDLAQCYEFAHILPEWFFVHALRLKSKNVAFISKIIQIVSEIPKSLIIQYFDDFLDFIDRNLQPNNIEILSSCIRNVMISIFSKIDLVITKIVSSIDYFDEQNLYSRLTLLNEIFKFNIDILSYIDVFNSVLESLKYITLSLPLLKAILIFFSIYAPFVTDDKKINKLYNIGNATIYSTHLFPESQSLFQNYSYDKIIYNACKNFYSISYSDIVSNPLYKLEDTYSLTSLGLLLIKKLPFKNALNIEVLTSLLYVCPNEAISFLYNIFVGQQIKQEYLHSYQKFCDVAQTIKNLNASLVFILLFSSFRQKITELNAGIAFAKEKYSYSIEKLPEDINSFRILLNTIQNSDFKPIILMKPNLLTLFLERNAPIIDNCIFDFFNNLEFYKTIKEKRKVRLFLYYFHKKQPEYSGYMSWIYREFFSSEESTKINYNIKNNFLTPKEEIQNFSYYYPIRLKSDFILTVIDIIKTYRKIRFLSPFLKFLITSNFNELVQKLCNYFWFIKYLEIEMNGFNMKFPDNCSNIKCIVLGIRNHKLIPSQIKFSEDWFLYQTYLSLNEEELSFIKDELIGKGNKLLSIQFFSKRLLFSNEEYSSLLNQVTCASSKQHLLRHLTNVIKYSFHEKKVQDLLISNQKDIIFFLSKCDLDNPFVFQNIFLFLSTVCINLPNSVYDDFYLKLILKYDNNFSSHVLYESVPALFGIFQKTKSKQYEKVIKLLMKWNEKLPSTEIYTMSFFKK